MLLLPIFLWQCIVLFSPCSTSSNGKAELVDAAVKALTTIANSDDYLLGLNLLGLQVESLMKAVIPIYEMVETGDLKPQSVEYRMLVDFRNRTAKILRDIGSRTGNARGTDVQYFEDMRYSIMRMKRRYDEYLDPTMYKADRFVEDYYKICFFEKIGPEVILTSLQYRMKKSCGVATTPEDAQKIADQREHLVRMIYRLQVNNERFPDLGLYLSEFIYIYQHLRLNIDLLRKDLDVYSLYFSSYQRAIEALFDELRNRASIKKWRNYESGCPLYALIIESNFNYPYIKAFVSELKSQLIDLSFMAASCVNVKKMPRGEYIDEYTKQISDYVTEISSFTAKWLNDSLISAWPTTHNSILNEQILQIMPKSGYVDDKTLKKVANLTHPLLINTGIPNYVYEILIVRAADKNYEMFFERKGSHCSHTKGTFGFDTIIGRIPFNSTNQQEKFDLARGMFNRSKYAKTLNTTIQSEMNSLYNAKNLPLIAETLKKKIGKKFITEKDFHCWAIVREWSYKPCPTIDYWSSSYNFVDLNSISTLSYKNKGAFYQNCEDFRFFFFM